MLARLTNIRLKDCSGTSLSNAIIASPEQTLMVAASVGTAPGGHRGLIKNSGDNGLDAVWNYGLTSINIMYESTTAITIVENHIKALLISSSKAFFSLRACAWRVDTSSLLVMSSISKETRSTARRLASSSAFYLASSEIARAFWTLANSDSTFALALPAALASMRAIEASWRAAYLSVSTRAIFLTPSLASFSQRRISTPLQLKKHSA